MVSREMVENAWVGGQEVKALKLCVFEAVVVLTHKQFEWSS